MYKIAIVFVFKKFLIYQRYARKYFWVNCCDVCSENTPENKSGIYDGIDETRKIRL